MAHITHGTYRAWGALGRGTYGGKGSLTYESSFGLICLFCGFFVGFVVSKKKYSYSLTLTLTPTLTFQLRRSTELLQHVQRKMSTIPATSNDRYAS